MTICREAIHVADDACAKGRWNRAVLLLVQNRRVKLWRFLPLYSKGRNVCEMELTGRACTGAPSFRGSDGLHRKYINRVLLPGQTPSRSSLNLLIIVALSYEGRFALSLLYQRTRFRCVFADCWSLLPLGCLYLNLLIRFHMLFGCGASGVRRTPVR